MAAAAFAHQAGITGYSGSNGVTCTSCHTGGQAPTVAISGPTLLGRGDTGQFTFTVHSSNPLRQIATGFNIDADGGTLLVSDSATEQRVSGELTHKQPIEIGDNDEVVWHFKWRAPNQNNIFRIFAAGNSVNDDGGTGGDRSATTIFMVAVGTVTPLPTLTPTGGLLLPTPTSTPSATTVAATATHSPSSTATASPTLTPTPSAYS